MVRQTGLRWPTPIMRSNDAPPTSVALPSSLMALPGGVSRPIRLGDDTTDFFTDASTALARASRALYDINPGTPIGVPIVAPPPQPYGGYGGGIFGSGSTPYGATGAPVNYVPILLLGGLGLVIAMAMSRR